MNRTDQSQLLILQLVAEHLSPNPIIAYAPRPIENVQIKKMAIPLPVIIGAIKALKNLMDASNFSAWKTDVTNKLDEISNKLDVVLAELRSLRVWTTEALDEQVRKVWSTSINSDRIALDGMIAGLGGHPPSKDMINYRLTPLLADVQKTTLNLADWATYGFSHFNEVASGFVVTVALMKLTKISDEEIKNMANRAVNYFHDAQDPSIDKSITTAHNNMAHDALATSQSLTSIMNRWWTTGQYSRPPKNEYDPGVHQYYFGYVPGNLSSGPGPAQSDQSMNNAKYPWYQGGSLHNDCVALFVTYQQQATFESQLADYVQLCGQIENTWKIISG